MNLKVCSFWFLLAVFESSISYGAVHRWSDPSVDINVFSLTLANAHLRTLILPAQQLGGGTTQPREILTRFNNIIQGFPSPDQASNFSDAALFLESFNEYFFSELDAGEPLLTLEESNFFLVLLKAVYSSVQNFCKHPNPVTEKYLTQIFGSSLAFIKDRYGLQKIEHSILNGSGFLGDTVYPNIPDALPLNAGLIRDTFRALSGRIFVVKHTAGQALIIGYSSGIVVPKRRLSTGPVLYNEIITCCHSVTLTGQDLDPCLEFYFVRSEGLDPNTGLPTPVDIIAEAVPGIAHGVDAIDVGDFVAYLRHASKNSANNMVRRIEKFRPIDQELSDLKHHCPKYDGAANDCGYGILDRGFNFAVDFSPICIMNHLEVERALSGALFNYYALGYPNFPYRRINPLASTPMQRLLKLTPLVLTRGNSGTMIGGQRVLRIENNLLQHEAPVMKGMSGGPVFMTEGDTIRIMGVIRGGALIEDRLDAAIL